MTFFLSLAFAIAQWIRSLLIAAVAALGLGLLLGWLAGRAR